VTVKCHQQRRGVYTGCVQVIEGAGAKGVDVHQIGGEGALEPDHTLAYLQQLTQVSLCQHLKEGEAIHGNPLEERFLRKIWVVMTRHHNELMPPFTKGSNHPGAQDLDTTYMGPEELGPEQNTHVVARPLYTFGWNRAFDPLLQVQQETGYPEGHMGLVCVWSAHPVHDHSFSTSSR